MNEHGDDLDPMVNRLRAFGERPVDRAVAGRVLERANRRRWAWLGSTRVKVAAAAVGGFLIGSMGLATAGALPAPAQDVAHAALGAVGVDVPPGHDRYNGPECGGAKNHGQYVRAHKGDPGAATSPCGKPKRSLDHPEGSVDTDADGPGRGGPPPWAHGKGAKDKAKNGAATDQDEDEDDDESPPTSAAPAVPLIPAPTTTAPSPTTTAAPTTTSSTTTTTSTTAPTPTTTTVA